MRILYVTPYIPSPIRVRPFNFIKGLSQLGHAITLCVLAPADELGQPMAIEPFCEEVYTIPLAAREIMPSLLLAMVTGMPLQAAFGRSSRMEKAIRYRLHKDQFDLIHVEHLRASVLGRGIKGVPKVYDSVDCISLLWERAAQSSPQVRTRLLARLELARTGRYESEIVQQYDRVLATSSEDAKALLSLAARAPGSQESATLQVLPNGVDLDYFHPLDLPVETNTLVFTGKMSYHANVAAVLHLCQDIMPLIWRERPDVRLWIVGQNPPASVRVLERDRRIEVTGYVEDLRPYLARATMAVSPICYGVGIQNKVLEPMAMGRPVVASSQVQGALRIEPGHDLMIADTTAEFAGCVIRLLDDSALCQKLGLNARRYMQEHHSWLSIAKELVAIYQETIDVYRTNTSRHGAD